MTKELPVGGCGDMTRRTVWKTSNRRKGGVGSMCGVHEHTVQHSTGQPRLLPLQVRSTVMFSMAFLDLLAENAH